MVLYKVTDEDGRSCSGGTGQWAVPDGEAPGAWMPMIADIMPCARGYHLCREGDLIAWLGPVVWEAEVAPGAEVVEADDKIVVSSARLVRRLETWTDRTARLFAADCAEHVLPLFARECPDDMRPREAIAAARAYVRGEIGAATGDAAWAAAGAAERAWQTARLLAYAREEVSRDGGR